MDAFGPRLVCDTCREPFEAGHVCARADPTQRRRRDIHDHCDDLAAHGVPEDVIAPIREYAESLVQKAVS